MLEQTSLEKPGTLRPASATIPGLFSLEEVRSLLRYKTYFRTEAVAGETLKAALSLRYQVYCLERNFEKSENFPDRLETDEFDTRSVHGVVFYRPRNAAIGTVRLILPNDDAAGLPVYSLLGCTNLARHFPRGQTAEVSRFAISRSFQPDRRDQSKLPTLGLAQILLRLSLANGITHWGAVMLPSLLRMLAMLGIEFFPVGPLVSYHGIRQPSVCNVEQMLETLLRRNPAHWQIVTDGGRLAAEFKRLR
ncbi:MAG TPA: GNAT family N-acyltransferase [Rhizomicrobium sp.]|jgi:N-acyl-L-homoserine lactone synthetase|nr:GNAT family N-acyltransferase [Rhizomicrobium sp.]